MDRNRLFEAVAAQRYRVCDTLDSLEPSRWDAPSLSAGWRVRDVVGHLVSLLDMPQWKWGVASMRHRGFNRAADHLAREYGDRRPAALIARYRELASNRFAPPIVGPIAPLVDVLVHTRDIERPLRIESTLPADAVDAALGFLTGARTFGFVRKGLLDGVRLEATDRDWVHGFGAPATGPTEALMMALAGRPAALDDLTGDGSSLLRSRLAG